MGNRRTSLSSPQGFPIVIPEIRYLNLIRSINPESSLRARSELF